MRLDQFLKCRARGQGGEAKFGANRGRSMVKWDVELRRAASSPGDQGDVRAHNLEVPAST